MVGALWFHLLSFTGTFVFLSFKTGDILLFEYFHPLSTETEDRKTKKRGDWKASEMWSPQPAHFALWLLQARSTALEKRHLIAR